MLMLKARARFLTVALHPEGVDRNKIIPQLLNENKVALHPEGVDRNAANHSPKTVRNASPSTRRAWIEILFVFLSPALPPVALHPEGVDRNDCLICTIPELVPSPSTRRAWIEIAFTSTGTHLLSGRPPPGGRG